MAKNLFAEIVSNELGIDVPNWRDYTISSPFRRDSNPSFRIYTPKDENDLGSAYDFGTGKAYTPVSFIMELLNLSYQEAVEYIYTHYGVQLNNELIKKDNQLTDLMRLIMSFKLKVSPILMEKIIIASLKNDQAKINSFIINFLPSPILI